MSISPYFALNFTSGVLDTKIAFSRADATATRVNPSGLVETVAADTPRFDYDPVTMACKGILIEESQENLVTYSEEFGNANWTKINATINSGATTAPSGAATGDRIVEGSITGLQYLLSTAASISALTTYTATVYAKADSANRYLVLSLNSSFNNYYTRGFDLTNKTLLQSHIIGFTDASATIADAGNGWIRCSVTAKSASGVTSTTVSLGLSSTTTWTNVARGFPSYTGNGTSGIYIWGAQLEEGSYPTSYIPTTTTALTRNADDALITGTNFSSFWQAGKGGVLVRALPSTVSGTRPLVQFDDNSADNIIALRGNTTNPELYIRSGGVDQATIDAGTISAATYRLAGTWAAGNAAASLNSGTAVLGAPGAIPAATQARLGSDGTNYLNGHLQALEYYDNRISNTGLRMVASTAGSRSMLQPIINRII